MRKYWRLLMLSVLFIFAFSFPVCADETVVKPELIYPTGLDELPENIPDPRVEDEEDIQPYSRVVKYGGTETDLFLELEEQFRTALSEGEPEIDVSDLYIDCDLYKIYRMVYFSPYLSNDIGFFISIRVYVFVTGA